MQDQLASRLFRLSAGVFFIGGFIASLMSLLVPKIRLSLAQDYAAATMVHFASHSSYLVLALPVAAVIAIAGYMRAHTLGLGLMATGAVGIIIAFGIGSYPLTLLALCAVSAGGTFLQIASNTAVTIVGDPERAAVRLNILQGLNSIGTVLGPLVGASFVLSNEPLARGVPALAVPFAAAAMMLAALAAAFWISRNLLISTSSDATHMRRTDWIRALRRPRLVMGAVAIFAYVGAEVAIGALLTNFLMLPHVLASDAVNAGRLVGLYWGGAMVGRFAGAWLLRGMGAPQLLLAAAMGATSLAAIAVLGHGALAAMALIGVGLFNSVMYPTIYVLALPREPGEATPGATILCMAVVGGAVIPVLTGVIADVTGLAESLVVPACCYVVVGLFARLVRNDRLVKATTKVGTGR